MLHMSEWLRSKTKVTVNTNKDIDQGKQSSTAGGSTNLYFGNQYGGFLKKLELRPSYTTPGDIPKEHPILP